MNLTFFCKVISKEEDHYIVELNADNMSLLPSENITKRKVYSSTNLPLDIIYVYDSFLEVIANNKKLNINKFYILVNPESKEIKECINVEPNVTTTEHSSMLNDEIKRMILDSSFVPADFYK